MGMYYDRKGIPMTRDAWTQAIEGDSDARRVASDMASDGKWVSTVWLGLNHAHDDGLPMIFETLVFTSKDSFDEMDGERYSTEAEALEGHRKFVEQYSQPTSTVP